MDHMGIFNRSGQILSMNIFNWFDRHISCYQLQSLIEEIDEIPDLPDRISRV